MYGHAAEGLCPRRDTAMNREIARKRKLPGSMSDNRAAEKGLYARVDRRAMTEPATFRAGFFVSRNDTHGSADRKISLAVGRRDS